MREEIKLNKEIYLPYLSILAEKIPESYLEEKILKNLTLFNYKSGLIINKIYRDLAAAKLFHTNTEFNKYIEDLSSKDSINSSLITLLDVIHNEISSSVYPKTLNNYWVKSHDNETAIFVVEDQNG